VVPLQQYVPLFLSKEDLDVAVAGAYQARNAAQISAVRAKAAEHEAAYQEALRKVGGTGEGRAACMYQQGCCQLVGVLAAAGAAWLVLKQHVVLGQ
jgi:hypothetical protein